MPRYSDERKEAVLAKLLPPHSLTVKQVAERENISEPTIYIYGLPPYCKH